MQGFKTCVVLFLLFPSLRLLVFWIMNHCVVPYNTQSIRPWRCGYDVLLQSQGSLVRLVPKRCALFFCFSSSLLGRTAAKMLRKTKVVPRHMSPRRLTRIPLHFLPEKSQHPRLYLFSSFSVRNIRLFQTAQQKNVRNKKNVVLPLYDSSPSGRKSHVIQRN